MPYDTGGKGGTSVPRVTLDAFADSLCPPAKGHHGPVHDAGTQLFCWAQHERVFLLRFADRGAQTAALGRLSLFMEDAGTRGTVVAALPTGQSAGVAAYSGHNFRSGDAASFFNAVREAQVTLSPAEGALRTLLLANRLLLAGPDGRLAGAPGLCVVTIARGLPRSEAMSTLLHECMHGLFYTSPSFAASVERFWNDALSQAQRDAWRRFLLTMGYDASHEELCINEFQAYMATERELFGGPAAGGQAVPGGKARGAGGSAGELASTLTDIQRAFAAAIGGAVPQPVPQLPGCACVFGDGARSCAPSNAADGPFKLRK